MSKKTETTLKLMEILKTGKVNAVERGELASLLGMTDRNMRECVAKARLEGVCIANDQDGVGYYIPTTTDELHRQIARVLSRVSAITKELPSLRKELEKLQGQLSLELGEADV